MKTPYVPHLFGEAAQAKLTAKQGLLTAGVVSSIAWSGATSREESTRKIQT